MSELGHLRPTSSTPERAVFIRTIDLCNIRAKDQAKDKAAG